MTQDLLDAVCALALEAGAAILDDKSRTSSVSLKKDESPLTSADLASHETILRGLFQIAPEVPVMSEESLAIPYAIRKTWTRYFLVDPLDGTKEFIKGKKEYTVNIALIENGVPVLGAVYVPELETLYGGAVTVGAFRRVGAGEMEPITVASGSQPVARVVGSSSHASPEMMAFLAQLGECALLQFGSSLKICQVADGTAHIYPRFGPTSEWDTAAGHAVVRSAGGRVVTLSGEDLTYTQKDSVLNPSFFVLGPTDRDWLAFARAASTGT